ncbi:MAG: MerR family transcriptional regulator [Bradyrhizobium sp.]|nr:MAG: MerR family transcriptional regulator [Bradyrhizobium sp.]
MSGYKIGILAKRAGANAPTIRYYEQIGLLRRPDRQDGNQRRYSDEDVGRLTFIRRCRAFGFSIDQVRRLAALVEDRSRSCVEARDIAQAHLAEVRAKLRELRALEKSFAGFVADCDAKCAGALGPQCAVLDELSVNGSTGKR